MLIILCLYICYEMSLFCTAAGDPEGQCAACAVESEEENSSKVKRDSFDEVYKPQELTDFDSLFNRNITRTSE